MTGWLRWALAGLLMLGLVAPGHAQNLAPPTIPYDLLFEATLVPTERLARARLRIGANQVDRMVFRIDPERHMNIRGDGKVEVDGTSATWEPPRTGGSLRYDFRVDALRGGSAYDARISEQWAIFRGSDLFPPARVMATDGSYSRSRLRLRMPKRWTSALPYEKGDNGYYIIDNPHRHFDRPTAWMALGRLGILRERIARCSVAVAGPFRQELRRQDILAMLRWTLPTLRDVLGELPLACSWSAPGTRCGAGASRALARCSFMRIDR